MGLSGTQFDVLSRMRGVRSGAVNQHCVKCGLSLRDFPLMQVQYINGKSIHFYLSVLSATARLPHLAWANMKIHREAICCKLAQLPFHLLASNWKGLRKCNLSGQESVSACVDSKPPLNFPLRPEAAVLPRCPLGWKDNTDTCERVHFARFEEAVSWSPPEGGSSRRNKNLTFL